MADKMDMYYFSPTGGTKKVSRIFAAALGRDVVWHNLGSKQTISGKPQGELAVVAAPVFGGRIPSVVREKKNARLKGQEGRNHSSLWQQGIRGCAVGAE